MDDNIRYVRAEMCSQVREGTIVLIGLMAMVIRKDKRMPVDMRYTYDIARALLSLSPAAYNYIMSDLVARGALKKFQKEEYYALLSHELGNECELIFIHEYINEMFKLQNVETDYSDYIKYKVTSRKDYENFMDAINDG